MGKVEEKNGSSSLLTDAALNLPGSGGSSSGNLKIDETSLASTALPPTASLSEFVRIPQSLMTAYAGFPATGFVNAPKTIGQTIVGHTTQGLVISHDGGAQWIVRNTKNGLLSDTVRDSLQVNDLLFVAQPEGLAVSKDKGVTFEGVPGLHAQQLYSGTIGPVAVNALYAHGGNVYVANVRGLAVSTDGGSTFEQRSLEQMKGIPGLIQRFTSVGNVLVVACSRVSVNGDNTVYPGGFARSIDGGKTWTRSTLTAGLTVVNGRDFATNGNIILYPNSSTLQYSTDAGVSFKSMAVGGTSGLGNAVLGVFYIDGRFFTTGDDQSSVSVSVDGLKFAKQAFTYSSVGTSTARLRYLVEVPGANEILATFDQPNTPIQVSTDEMKTLTRRALSEGVRILADGANANYMYSSGSDLYLARTNGIARVAGGGAAVQAENILVTSSDAGFNTVDANTVNTVALVGTRLIAATKFGLFWTDNFSPSATARTWVRKSAISGLEANVNCANAASNFMFACTTKGMAMSTDSGATFSFRTTVNGLASNTVNRFQIYGFNWFLATPSGLSYSTDGGSTFKTQSFTGLIAGSVINSVHKLENNQLYVLAPGGVAYSNNDGASWAKPANFTENGKALAISNLSDVRGIALLDGVVYVGTSFGVAASEDMGKSFHLVGKGFGTPAQGFILDLAIHGGELFVSTTGGVYKMVRAPQIL